MFFFFAICMASALSCWRTCRQHRLFISLPICLHPFAASKHFLDEAICIPGSVAWTGKETRRHCFSRQHSFLPSSSSSHPPFFSTTILTTGHGNVWPSSEPRRAGKSNLGRENERTILYHLNQPPHLPLQRHFLSHLSLSIYLSSVSVISSASVRELMLRELFLDSKNQPGWLGGRLAGKLGVRDREKGRLSRVWTD